MPSRVVLLRSLVAAAVLVGVADLANAQCSTCAQTSAGYTPVAQTSYMPVAQTAYMPVSQTVYSPVTTQATTVYRGWYPGMYVRRMLGWGDPAPAAAATYTTAAYQPTYPPSYSVGYAPATYNVGYAPTAYTAGYAAVASATYTTNYRAVTLSPVTTCCEPVVPACATDCASCGGNGCSSCAGGASQAVYQESPSNYGNDSYGGGPTPAPYIDPNAPVATERQKPPVEQEKDAESDEESVLDAEQSNFFHAPPLYAPNAVDRVTRKPAAPVWNAVYKRDTSVRQASATTQQPARAPQHRSLGASGWSSASN
ncbi:hypothetical protein KOR34_13040 [Posidoniimonas corsicana]|uniref:Uncharacterized protein n=1 Tax=Posidoniimonas corsicana TaxID=1938618 RepID=A0A5C5VET0_9BACT|nr:hypothetical protein [Posidoniimonas corsicana]TWT36399.1 hypothetical protein KOR34_13040 [Posidoniimonas corsicana]